MFVIVEEGNNITVGTAPHEPNDFLYLAFVMGICNIDDGGEMLESRVEADEINKVMGMSMDEICSKLEAITRRSGEETSCYEWSTYISEDEPRRGIMQIITDAEYHDGVATFRYNYSLRDAVLELQKYYRERLEKIIQDYYS